MSSKAWYVLYSIGEVVFNLLAALMVVTRLLGCVPESEMEFSKIIVCFIMANVFGIRADMADAERKRR